MDDHRRIEVSRTVDAPAERVFALLVDPSRHSEPDGSGMVRGLTTPGPVTTTDQRFRMAMHRDERGHYETDNLVTTYEPDQAIRWATTYPDHAPLGLTWTYTLTPDGHRTLVTHTYDWSGVTDPELLPVFPRVSREQMAGTLDRLAEAVAPS